MDATAKAIAHAREQEGSEKPDGAQRSPASGPQVAANRGGKNGGFQTSAGQAPATSTKRPKKPG